MSYEMQHQLSEIIQVISCRLKYFSTKQSYFHKYKCKIKVDIFWTKLNRFILRLNHLISLFFQNQWNPIVKKLITTQLAKLSLDQLFFILIKMQRQYAKALDLSIDQLDDFSQVRAAYKRQMSFAIGRREKRVKLNRAYSEVCAKIFKSTLSSLQIMIIQGNLQGLKSALLKDKKLLNAKVNQYPIIYLAVRSGHYDITKLLLKYGCSLDFKNCMSTPMHCAAYYGHYSLIPLLLMYGMPIDIQNKHGMLPIQEAASPEIEKLLTVVKESRILTLNQNLRKSEISQAIINIKNEKGQVVVKKIITINYFKFYNHYSFDDAFHGTRFDSLFSILKYGLKKAGDIVNGKKIDTVEGHIPLGSEFQGKKDWSRAIFVSPSVYYAAHPVYSQEFIQNNDHTAWLPLVQVKVKKGSYSRHDHTLGYYDAKNKEPTSLEFRVECADKQQNLIMRSEDTNSVVVIAAIFIKKGFLEDNENYQKVTKMMLNSYEQRKFRTLNA